MSVSETAGFWKGNSGLVLNDALRFVHLMHAFDLIDRGLCLLSQAVWPDFWG